MNTEKGTAVDLAAKSIAHVGTTACSVVEGQYRWMVDTAVALNLRAFDIDPDNCSNSLDVFGLLARTGCMIQRALHVGPRVILAPVCDIAQEKVLVELLAAWEDLLTVIRGLVVVCLG
jgi:hypothetical protein